jgi:hypothetical protein
MVKILESFVKSNNNLFDINQVILLVFNVIVNTYHIIEQI